MLTAPLTRPRVPQPPGEAVLSTPERTDADLLAAVGDGDRAALEELYRRHAPWLAARLRRRCSDLDLVDEVPQDAFLAAWRGAGRYDGRGEVGAWRRRRQRVAGRLRGRLHRSDLLLRRVHLRRRHSRGLARPAGAQRRAAGRRAVHPVGAGRRALPRRTGPDGAVRRLRRRGAPLELPAGALRRRTGPWHLAQAPLTVLGGALLGIMVARWTSVPGVALLVMIAMVLYNAWINEQDALVQPLGTYVSWATWAPHPDWAGMQPGSPAWNVVYLLALCAMAACGSFLRDTDRPWRVLARGAVLTAGAVVPAVAQLP